MPSSLIRWSVPAAAAAVVAGSVLAPSLASAGTPVLPKLTPAQLLTAAATARVDGLSGTVRSSSDLGLPALPGVAGAPSGLTGLVTGTHTLRVWAAGQDDQRVSVDDSLAEYDVVRRGTAAWTYDSRTDTVTTSTLPARAARPAGSELTGTPQQAAAQVLAAVGPTTAVSVATNVRVAGRAAYELVLRPKDRGTLVGQVRLAMDGSTKLPLRVQVIPRGRTSPALSVGFTKISFAVPAARVFATPTGKATRTVTPSGPHSAVRGAGEPQVSTVGSGWTTVVVGRMPADGTASGLVGQVGSPVTVARVHGHLVRSALVTALVLDDGRVYAGAVTPELLTTLAARR